MRLAHNPGRSNCPNNWGPIPQWKGQSSSEREMDTRGNSEEIRPEPFLSWIGKRRSWWQKNLCPKSHRFRDTIQPITRTTWFLSHFIVPPFLHRSSDFTPGVHLEWVHPREGRSLWASPEQRWQETITALKHVGDLNRLLQVTESLPLQHRAPSPHRSPGNPCGLPQLTITIHQVFLWLQHGPECFPYNV